MRETLVLTRSDTAALLGWDECIAAMEQAFRLHAEGRSLPPGVLGVKAPGGGFHTKAAGLPLGRPYYAVKTNANFMDNPARHGLPAIQGVLVLFDAENGFPLAVVDSIEVTIRRTASATALAAKHLARPDASAVAVAGCGNQGRAQLRALARMLPLRHAYAYDADAGRARSYAREMSAALGFDVVAVETVSEAAAHSDVVVTCTPSRRPLLLAEHVRPGTFVAAVGADSADKQELEPRLMAAGVVVADILEQCAAIGDLHHAITAGVLTKDTVHAELADVVVGRKPGRRSADEITIFDSTGTALQDVAAAAVVYEEATERGIGLRVDFGA
jgi:alanine dehydrogenase